MCLPEAEFKPFVLGEGNFIKQLVNFDKDNITDQRAEDHWTVLYAARLPSWDHRTGFERRKVPLHVGQGPWRYSNHDQLQRLQLQNGVMLPLLLNIYIYIYKLYNILIRQIPTKNYNGNYIAISTSGLFKAL